MPGARSALVLGLVLALPAHAAERATWCYPSGLKVGLEVRPGSPVVGLATVVSGGSGAEGPDEVGAAHLAEHLWFRSPRLDHPHFDALVHAVGGEANAVTSWDETAFLTVAPRSAVSALIAVEAERLAQPWVDLDPAVFETEQRVVRNELALRYEGREPALQVLARQLLPADHPYARPVSGRPEQVATLDAATVQAWTRRTTTPANTSILVLADLEPATLLRLVHSAFDPALLASPTDPDARAPVPCEPHPTAPATDVPEPAAEAWAQVEAGVGQRLSGIAWTLPSDAGPEARAAAAMMQGEINRYTRLRVQCEAHPLVRLTLLTCLVPDPQGRGQALWKRPFLLTDRLWLHEGDEVTDRAARSHGWFAWGQALEQEIADDAGPLHPGGRLLARARRFHRTGDPGPDSTRPTAADVARLGHTWLTDRRLRGLVLDPAPTLAAAETGFHSARGSGPVEPDPGEVTLERLRSLIYDPGFDRLRTASEGATAWVLPWEGAIRARISAVFPGGPSWNSTALRDRSLHLLAPPWQQVDAAVSRQALLQALTLDGRTADHARVLTATGPVDPVVGLLDAALPDRPAMISRAEAQTGAESLLGWRQAAATNATWVATAIRWRALAPTGPPHPWLDPRGTEAYDRIRRSQARTFLQQLLDRRRVRWVAVVPSAQADRTLEALAAVEPDAVSAQERPSTPATLPAADAEPRSVVLLAPDEPGPLAEITLECHVLPRDPVVWWVLEEALDRALHQTLRNDLGIAYDVDTTFERTAHGPVLRVDTQVPHEGAGAAVRALLDTLEQTRAPGLDAPTLDRYRLELARRTALRWQDPDAVLRLLEESVLWGGERADPGLAERLHGVTADDLAQSLSQCVDHEAITVIADGPGAAAGLERAGVVWRRWTP